MKTQFPTPRAKRYSELVSRLDRIIALLTDLKKDALVGDADTAATKEYYTNEDLCRILRVSKRTLARYRQKKLIPYYMICGKVYYKVSEAQNFLRKAVRK